MHALGPSRRARQVAWAQVGGGGAEVTRTATAHTIARKKRREMQWWVTGW